MNRRSLTAALTLAVAAVPNGALAQPIPDIQDAISRGGQIDEAIRAQEQLRPRGDMDDQAIGGEAGVYILTVNDIFYVGGAAGAGWMDNPLRTSDDVGGSGFANAAVTAGVQTRLGESVDAGLGLTLSGTEYFKDFAPSSRTLSTAANVGTRIGTSPFYVGITGFGGYSFDRHFKSSSGFYGANLSLSTAVPLGRKTLLRASVDGGRQMGDIKENDNWSAGGSVQLAHALGDRLTVGAEARATRNWFDDFYEDVTFVQRRDWDFGGNVNASYHITGWLGLTAAIGYQKRSSSFFLSAYDGFEGQVGLTVRKRF